MSYSPVEWYWWCIPPLEKAALNLCISQYVANPLPMLKAAFDTAWELFGGTPDSDRYKVFIAESGLTLVTITDGEMEVGAYAFDPFYYTLLVDFVFSSPTPPDPPCYLSRHTVQ